MSDGTKRVTVTDGGVEVQRTIDDRSTATVVVYRLKTGASAPSVVHVEEAIPPRDRVETLEFHPEHLPNDWTKGDGAVEFDVIVPPNETRMVAIGLEATEEEPLGRAEPTVSRSELAVDDLRDPDGSASVTPGGTVDVPGEEPSVLDRDIEPVADGGDTSADSGSDDVLDLPDPNADDAGTDDGAGSDGVIDLPDPSGSATADAAAEGGPDVDESATAGSEPSPSSDIDGDDRTRDGDAVDDLRLDDGSADELRSNGDAADDPTVDDDGSAANADDESLVGDLLGEIRAGHASEEELDALRSELGVARADEVRVQHVQSRMSDFEAYVDALEGIINTHGTAAEFVDNIERSVTDLEDELGVVREEVGTVEDGLETADDDRERLSEEVADLDETVVELTDEVAELHDLVEAADERTDTLETELRGEIEALRDERAAEFDRIEAELDSLRDQLEAGVEPEIDSLREDVESFNELRHTLLDAFGNGVDATPADDDTER